MTKNWKAKIAALFIAIAIWSVIKRQVDTPPGGSGSGFHEAPRYDSQDYFAIQATLTVEEPSWYFCGEYIERLYVFHPPGSSVDLHA